MKKNNKYKIYYGVIENKIVDVTEYANKYLKYENFINIPATEVLRAYYFDDPLPGTLKSIYVRIDSIIYEIDPDKSGLIDIKNNKFFFGDKLPLRIKINRKTNPNDVIKRLESIHKSIIINDTDDLKKIGGFNFMGELPEQVMSLLYINGNERILELGANIGRNTILLSKLLNNPKNHVALETDLENVKILEKIREDNNLEFSIEPSALSKRMLIQKGWSTIPSDDILPGYKEINTIDYDQLCKKYFAPDTLVIDCEGAFYYILLDMPQVLDGVTKIIMENDYNDIEQKKYIESVLESKSFNVVYSKNGGWGPCKDSFYEVWLKKE